MVPGSRLSSTVQHITDCIVASYPVPIAATANLMVPEWVRCGVALWAGVGRTVEWHTQPVPQAAAKLLIVK